MALLTRLVCGALRCLPRAPRKEGEAKANPADDLSAIRGIGIATQDRLYSAGIKTYAQLARSSPEELRRILGRLGQGAKVEDWIAQANALATEAASE